jgi:hypothetical protein
MRYGIIKLANVLFASELQRRINGEDAKIVSLSLNPVTVRTDGAADVMPFMVRPLVYLLFTAPERGADTSLFAATAKEIKESSEQWEGRYLDGPGRIKVPPLRAWDSVNGPPWYSRIISLHLNHTRGADNFFSAARHCFAKPSPIGKFQVIHLSNRL